MDRADNTAVVVLCGAGSSVPARLEPHLTAHPHPMASTLHAVLAQVSPDSRLSRGAIEFIGDVGLALLETLAVEAATLAHRGRRNRVTVTHREVQTAVRLLLPGELARHAVSEGVKAITRFASSQ